MRLLMLGQMSFLSKTFSTKLARKGFFARVCPHVDVDTVFVFKSFVTYVTIMKQPRLFLGFLLVSSVILPGLGKL